MFFAILSRAVIGLIVGVVVAVIVDAIVIEVIEGINSLPDRAVWSVRYTFWQPAVLVTVSLACCLIGAVYGAAATLELRLKP